MNIWRFAAYMLICGIVNGCDFQVYSAKTETTPSFSLHPVNITVQQDSEVVFFARAEGNPAPVINWEFSPDGINWSDSGSEPSDMYSFTAESADNGMNIRAVAVNSQGRVVSQMAVLNVVSTGIVSQVTQYGITWTFDKEYQTGTFVNGDYWVTGPVVVTSVYPSPLFENGIYHNGSMVNPPNGNQSYDSGTEYYGHPYNNDLRIVFPATVGVNSSLVSTISVMPSTADPHPRPSLKSASVLTVLSSVPVDGSFRPGLIGADKKIYNVNNVKWSLLPALVPVSGMPSTESIAEKYTRLLKRPWLLHGTGWLHRHIMPEDNSPSYHRDVAMLLDEAAVLCITGWSSTAEGSGRRELVINYIQVAIDYYAMQRNGVSTGIQGAYNYRWPTVFAGIMLGDADMMNMWVNHTFSTPSYHQNHLYFWEDSLRTVKSDTLPDDETRTYYRQRTGRKPVFWDDGNHNHPDYGYHEELTPAEWYDDSKMPQDAFGSDEQPGLKQEGYRQMHSASIPGFALAVYSFNEAALNEYGQKAEYYFDFTEYFGYADRWMYETVEIVTESGCGSLSPYTVQTSYCEFVDQMWFAYRDSF